MKLIPSRIHGWLDYGLGVLLLLVPYVFGFAGGAAGWVSVVLGAGIILYSLLTKYELGMLPLIPFKAHLALDIVGGVVLIVAALALGGGVHAWLPLLILGVAEIGTVLLTRPSPGHGFGLDRGAVMESGLQPYPAMPAAASPRTAGGRPKTTTVGGEPRNVEQLRRAIDSGATGDKVDMTDPASVPLGSDDEAGQPHDEQGLRVARHQGAR